MFSSFSKSATRLTGFCLWVAGGFFAAQLVIGLLLPILIKLSLLQVSWLKQAWLQLVLVALAYSLALAIIVGLPRLWSGQKLANLKKTFGIVKTARFQDTGLSVLGYGVYLALTIGFSFLARLAWPNFNPDQAQSVGFQSLNGGFEYVAAFVALAVVAPIVEELLFRGYLFGKLRLGVGFLPSALATSLLFGAVHLPGGESLQWNVAIDVFALSLVLCYLREKTGAVWAGIGLHMLKNSVAFGLLFLHFGL